MAACLEEICAPTGATASTGFIAASNRPPGSGSPTGCGVLLPLPARTTAAATTTDEAVTLRLHPCAVILTPLIMAFRTPTHLIRFPAGPPCRGWRVLLRGARQHERCRRIQPSFQAVTKLMNAADRERAFDRFWSASGSHHDGTGLGLPIVRHLVDASGGTITLNPAPGTGLDAALLLRPVTRQRSHGARTPQRRHQRERDDRPGPELDAWCRDIQHVRTGCPGSWQGQPMPVSCRAVVQLVLMALRAEERVMVPAQTAFLSFVSTPSLVVAVFAPE